MPSLPRSSAAEIYRPKADNFRGILWMLGAVAFLTAMFAVIKVMVAELPVFVVAIMRTIFSLLFIAPFMLGRGVRGIATKRPFGHLCRAAFGIASFVCVVYAVAHLILADAMVLSFTTPFWSFLLSIALLGERIIARRVWATIAGFVGILFIVKPTGDVAPAALVAIVSAMFTSGAMITMKKLSATEPPNRIVFYFFFFGTLILAPFAALDWQTPTLVQFGWFAAAGAFGVLGQNCLTRAYDAAEVTVLGPYDFLRLPLAALIGFVVFAEIPDIWTGIGATIIILASFAIARAERRTRAPA